MGEIKSTIDLVMEKTKGLKLTEEDKQTLEEEKQERAAHAAVMRYLTGDMSREEITHKVESSSGAFQRGALRSLVENMGLAGEEFSRALKVLEETAGGEARLPLKQLRDLSLQFAKTLQKHKKKVKTELWADLAQKGVQGSAVEPNLNVSPQWVERVRRVEREYAPRLEEIKETLLAKLGMSE